MKKTNSFFFYLSHPSISNIKKTTPICQQPNVKTKKNYNPGQNFLELYSFLAQVRFTTSKAKLDIRYNKLVIRVASRVTERLKTYDLRKLGILEKSQINVET